jgi:hypothetical protein
MKEGKPPKIIMKEKGMEGKEDRQVDGNGH